jgi:uncharacterized membrane protein SpoIIM required for sporulation
MKMWEEFDQLLDKSYQAEPDTLYELYIKLTDDLAYARTYFPESEAVHFLNQLTQKAHGVIYQSQPTDKTRLFRFWKTSFPLLVYQARREVSISFFIFLIAVFIGILSHKNDVRFVNIIMGDSYVNMTLSNIEKGDPLAVYKSMNEVEMFLGISINNIRVAFVAFIFGIFTSFGTGFILIRNGIMLGTFHAFLADYDLVLESIATIWIHGTLEIFAIIVAGGAGIILGNSFIFTGTYSRGYAFRKGALKGIKIAFGLIPIFLIAGFLEGFVTRHTEYSYLMRFSIIGASLLFISYYFYFYPRKLISNKKYHGKHDH